MKKTENKKKKITNNPMYKTFPNQFFFSFPLECGTMAGHGPSLQKFPLLKGTW